MIIYDVVYFDGKAEENVSISEAGYKVFQEDIKLKGYKIISVTERVPEKKPVDENVLKKRKFYNSQYSTEKRRLDRNAITKEIFDNRIDLLKKLMKECEQEKMYKIKYKMLYK